MRPGVSFSGAALDGFAAWGRDGPARRAIWAAQRSGKALLTLEDGFLRSLDGGWGAGPMAQPLSLLPDWRGAYYDATAPSDLECLLAGEGWETPGLIARARAGIALLRERRLSKYNAAPDEGEWGAAPPPAPGFVLVIDQTRGDASIRWGGAGPDAFKLMLAAARAENPGAEIVIRTHPDVLSGRRKGHFSPADLDQGMRLFADPLNPWALIERASKVYAVTSQLGFEAMMAEKPVRLFGMPFYGGWGLAEGERPEDAPARRRKARSVEEVFAAAWLLHPLYYDPYKNELTDFERTVETLTRLRHANSEHRRPVICLGMSRWKRGTVTRFLTSTEGAPEFEDNPARAVRRAARSDGELVVWSSKETPDLEQLCTAEHVPLKRMEDGFLRSAGLGAALVPALSLALDGSGVYYDPTRPSDLEALIEKGGFDARVLARARALRRAVIEAGLSKYNVGGVVDFEPKSGASVVLVPGQVEDDASIRLGAPGVKTNVGLLQAARNARPNAFIVYKLHPDVEAGLRAGAVPEAELTAFADHIARNAEPASLIDRADEIWTITSLMGFEGLMRGKRVTCLGQPFYAGWGLTNDAAPMPRRMRKATLDELVAAALILYPRYLDPVSGLPCEVEVVVKRLIDAADAPKAAQSPALRTLSALQSLWKHAAPRR